MAARAIASGTITFGLVSVPVKLYTATRPKSVSFNLLHEKDKARLRQQYLCGACGETVDRKDMVRGFEYAKDQYVVLTDEELRKLEKQTDQSIEIEEFVPIEQVDPIYFSRSYFLGPDKGGAKAYRLLTKAMEKAAKGAVAKFNTRGKQELVLLRQAHEGLILHTLYYADEVNSIEEIDRGEGAALKEGEIALAIQLIEQLGSTKFDPSRYEDEYRNQVMNVIEQKVAGEEITVAPPRAPRAQVIDLMDALKKSLAERQKEREREEPRRPARAKGRPAAAKRPKAAKAK